jgi:hypothetical protein
MMSNKSFYLICHIVVLASRRKGEGFYHMTILRLSAISHIYDHAPEARVKQDPPRQQLNALFKFLENPDSSTIH